MTAHGRTGPDSTPRSWREQNVRTIDLVDLLASPGEPTMPKIASHSGVITATLLLTLAGTAGCGTGSPNASVSPIGSGSGDDAVSWCASAAAKYPKRFAGMSLRYSVTSTLAGVDAWRAEQGRAGDSKSRSRLGSPLLRRSRRVIRSACVCSSTPPDLFRNLRGKHHGGRNALFHNSRRDLGRGCNRSAGGATPGDGADPLESGSR
jgi:hypothetical protein